MAFILREDQAHAKGRVRQAFADGKKSVLVVAPTGYGKTVVFSDIARSAAGNRKNVLIMAHRRELLTQCGDKLVKNAVDFGYINRRFTPNPHTRVQVGSVQTIVKRMRKLKFVPDIIIIDEAHRVMAKTYRDILAYYPNAWVMGFYCKPYKARWQAIG